MVLILLLLIELLLLLLLTLKYLPIEIQIRVFCRFNQFCLLLHPLHVLLLGFEILVLAHSVLILGGLQVLIEPQRRGRIVYVVTCRFKFWIAYSIVVGQVAWIEIEAAGRGRMELVHLVAAHLIWNMNQVRLIEWIQINLRLQAYRVLNRLVFDSAGQLLLPNSAMLTQERILVKVFMWVLVCPSSSYLNWVSWRVLWGVWEVLKLVMQLTGDGVSHASLASTDICCQGDVLCDKVRVDIVSMSSDGYLLVSLTAAIQGLVGANFAALSMLTICQGALYWQARAVATTVWIQSSLIVVSGRARNDYGSTLISTSGFSRILELISQLVYRLEVAALWQSRLAISSLLLKRMLTLTAIGNSLSLESAVLRRLTRQIADPSYFVLHLHLHRGSCVWIVDISWGLGGVGSVRRVSQELVGQIDLLVKDLLLRLLWVVVAVYRPAVTLVNYFVLGLGLHHGFCSFRCRIKFLKPLVELVSVGQATMFISGLMISFSSDGYYFLVCRRHLCQKDRSLIAFAVLFAIQQILF